jgi:hypothetical protein
MYGWTRSARQRNSFGLNRYFALGCCLSMIFSENRYLLFGIMLYAAGSKGETIFWTYNGAAGAR